MSLIGRRPTNAYALRSKDPVRLPRAGICFYCRTDLKTDLDARMHYCDSEVVFSPIRRRRSEGQSRVRL